jgi:hypothetical protein
MRCWALPILFCFATSAQAQEPRLAGRLDPATLDSVQAVLDSARADRLPIEPLVDKALEGKAKGASDARIVAAVRLLRARLAGAREALGSEAGQAELVAGAVALGAGIPDETLRALRAERVGTSIILPLTALSDLVSRGVSVDTARTTVLRVLERNPRDDARLRAFVEDVRRDIADGKGADRAAAERAGRAP